jgi:type 1 fimbriae regulatory protein FimE
MSKKASKKAKSVVKTSVAPAKKPKKAAQKAVVVAPVKRKSKSSRPLPPNKPRNVDVRSREYLTAGEIRSLKSAASKAPLNGFRDRWLIAIIYAHALRVSEACDLRWDQVDLQRAKLHVNRLKNGDPSVHYLEGEELRAFRQLRRDHPDSDFVFNSQRQGPLSSRQVHTIIARAGEAAGITFPVHPHMLRHAKGFQLAGRGEDTRAIQGYFGHKAIQHTVLYTKLDPKRYKGFGRD